MATIASHAAGRVLRHRASGRNSSSSASACHVIAVNTHGGIETTRSLAQESRARGFWSTCQIAVPSIQLGLCSFTQPLKAYPIAISPHAVQYAAAGT